MKCSYLGACGGQIVIVSDHIVGNGETLLTTRLSRQDTAGLILGLRVTHEQAPYLGVLVAVDNQNSIDERPQGRVDQERYYNQLIITTCSIRLTVGFFLDARVQDRFESMARILIRKYDLAHFAAAKRAIRIDHGLAKGISDFIEGRLARHYDFTRNDIGIDDGCTEFGE